MKNPVWLIAIGVFACLTSVGNNDCSHVKRCRPSIWMPERLGFREHVLISNNHNFYRIDMIQLKPDGKQLPKLQFQLFEPREYAGFSRPVMNFIRLKVNGINATVLHPEKDDVKLWKRDGMVGCDMALNFDGAKLIISWFMRPDSPVLWATVKPAPDLLEPIRSIQLSIVAMPSAIAKSKTGKVIFNGAYERQAVSPVKTYGMSKKRQLLSKKDTYLILQDEKFQPGGAFEGCGPCFITFDHSELNSAELDMRNIWLLSLNFNIKADFKNFRFGLWQSKQSYRNDEFLNMLKKKIFQFTLKQ